MEEKVEEEGGWRGQGKVRRSFFNEFSLIFIELSLILRGFGRPGRLERPGESPEKFFNKFSLIFIDFSLIFIDFY